MKDSLKKYVSTRRKESLSFVLARKSVSTTRNEAFVEIYKYGKTASSGKKKKKIEKWFPLGGN